MSPWYFGGDPRLRYRWPVVEGALCVEYLYRVSNDVNAILITIIDEILAGLTLYIRRSGAKIARVEHLENAEYIMRSIRTCSLRQYRQS